MIRRSLSCFAGEVIQTRKGKTVSRLPNGLKVLSFNDGSGATGLGLFTLNGPRFEEIGTSGCAALLENLALKGNSLYNQEQLSKTIGYLGNAVKITNHKECFSYILHAPRYHVREGLAVLNSMALHPTKDPEVFSMAQQGAKEASKLFSRDSTRVCFEMIHQAAWGGKGLGLPLIPSVAAIDAVTLEKLHLFHRKYTRPDRCVVVGTGVADHEEFVSQVAEEMKFECDSGALNVEPAPYTGGSLMTHNTVAPESVKKFAEKNLTHASLCFKGVPVSHADYYAYSVIQTLLGGGTSFSTGGPGKGLFTKLFREVINREAWIHGIECVTAWYSDAGLVGLYGQCGHEYVQNLIATMAFQAATIPDRVPKEYLEMAKNQLMSQLILLGETREMAVEESGKYLLMHNHILHTDELLQGTTNVSMDDLKRVCKEMLNHPLTYVLYGNTDLAQKPSEVAQLIAKVPQSA